MPSRRRESRPWDRRRSLARLETSKSFTRNLLEKYGIPGNPRFRNFTSLAGIEAFFDELDGIVLKPDGLTGGKGVLVQGDHFQTRAEALDLCRDILKSHPGVTVEEKLEGEEFSLQCLCDGRTVVATPPVQDHKRRFVDDRGPNTGGMGSYSCADHLLPFLDAAAVAEGLEITRKVAEAIRRETGVPYKGIMYGGFMITRSGVKLIEYNARFGDPEAMNILPLLRTDFIDVCRAIIDGRLDRLDIVFEKKATVCKYVVPKGYGLPQDHPEAASDILPDRDRRRARGAALLFIHRPAAGRALHDLVPGDRRGRHRRRPGGGGTDRRKGRRRHPGSRGPPAGHRHRTAHPEADSTHEETQGKTHFIRRITCS